MRKGKKKGAILSCMFGNKEMRKEKRIIHFFFLLFAKTKEIKWKIYVFNFYVHMNVKDGWKIRAKI